MLDDQIAEWTTTIKVERLLRGLAAQLDDAGRGTLALAAKLL